MADTKIRGWKLLVIPDDESGIKQFRLTRWAATTLVSVVILLVVYAAVETVLFWIVAKRAAQVEPLRMRIRELESSTDELGRLSTELTRLRNFEQQIRRILTGREGDARDATPWESIPFSGLPGAAPNDVNARATASPVGEARSLRAAVFTALDIPTVPPARGYITRQFLTPSPARQISHFGLDIAAREGSPVLAAADGLVVFAEWTYRYGNLVVIAHRSGYLSFYGHNQVLLTKPGERVRQAEPIALLGNSGVSTAPHVHFEIWHDGVPVDPMTLLRISP